MSKKKPKVCPHCNIGTLQEGRSHRYLVRCDYWQECGRYVYAD